MQRVLRSSRRRVVILFLLFVITEAWSQVDSDEEQLLLESGPTLFRGVDFLEPNVYPFWYGEYVFETRDDIVVAVYYFDSPLDEAGSWQTAGCTGLPLRTDAHRFFYAQVDDWSLVVAVQARFPEESSAAGLYPDPDRAVPDLSSLPCRFTRSFITEHVRFQSVEGDRRGSMVRPPAFPAFVPLP